MHNQDFKPLEFDGFRGEAGFHAFTMSPSKWIEGVNAMSERIVLLRELAVKQMETLSMVSMDDIKQLPGGDSEKE